LNGEQITDLKVLSKKQFGKMEKKKRVRGKKIRRNALGRNGWEIKRGNGAHGKSGLSPGLLREVNLPR